MKSACSNNQSARGGQIIDNPSSSVSRETAGSGIFRLLLLEQIK